MLRKSGKTLRDLREAWLEWSADRLRLEQAERIVGSLDSVVETTGKLAAMRARLDGACSRRQSIDSNVVPLVDRQIDDARQVLEIGEGDSLVLLESLVRAHEAKLDLIEARLEESATQNEIRHLTGPDRIAATTK